MEKLGNEKQSCKVKISEMLIKQESKKCVDGALRMPAAAYTTVSNGDNKRHKLNTMNKEPVISWDNILHNATPQIAVRVFSLRC